MLQKAFASRRGIIRLIAASVLLLSFSGVFFVPLYYSTEGDFFYPMVYFYGTAWVYVVQLGAFALLFYHSIPTTTPAKIIASTLIMFPCFCLLVGFFCYYFFVVSYYPLPAHFNAIRFQDHTYYLAWDNFTSQDLDSEHNRYLIYRCDRLGVTCHRLTSLNGWRYEAISGYNFQWDNVYFVIEDNQLYVQIGTERVTVPARPD